MTTCKTCGHEIRKEYDNVKGYFHVSGIYHDMKECSCGCTTPEPKEAKQK